MIINIVFVFLVEFIKKMKIFTIKKEITAINHTKSLSAKETIKKKTLPNKKNLFTSKPRIKNKKIAKNTPAISVSRRIKRDQKFVAGKIKKKIIAVLAIDSDLNKIKDNLKTRSAENAYKIRFIKRGISA